nr:uncharacterized protein LOC123493671 isoform X3 [Aegilops tauschii subsp. strangulata]
MPRCELLAVFILVGKQMTLCKLLSSSCCSPVPCVVVAAAVVGARAAAGRRPTPGTPRCSLPSLWAPDARQAVDAPNLKAGRATPAAPASVVLNFAPGQLPQDLMLFRLLLL